MSSALLDLPVKISSERLYQSLMDLAKIGATSKGGNCRLALTPLDGQGRDLVTAWMREAGMTITVDQVGNIFARRAGKDNELPPIMTGSHIDTQPTGGKFDGCFGVLAGLEVVRTLNDHDIETNAPIEVVIWTNEEGTRFVPVMMGSGAFVGKFKLEDILNTTDKDGKRVGDELKAIGYDGKAPVGGRAVGAYFEAHIEQGPILEHENKVIGVVTGSLGLRWYDVTVTGMEMHAGPTPMPIRQDALYAATFIMQDVIQNALDHAPHGRGTVGSATVHPSSRNVIPGKVTFTVDIRHENADQLRAMHERLLATCSSIEKSHNVTVRVEEVSYFPPTPFDPTMVNAVREAAKSSDLSYMDIVTGAGHDAVYMASVTPTAMIFVPCKDGVSHNEIEDAKPEDLAAGAQVLYEAMLPRAML
ncbi:Zn-dependent hydrolase [Orrella daihaiensis]|uniref:Zn-dependent hydrolase n=1 Tax=Orrella daihaiensis TaxID=2782176 RepID=A0ABY4AGR9_9BURK|nr:Zn-dependent hydrolase [Orrella daihaiensis]UOD49491.1 Zn-dependent hydrolase [Orrella daihaiensis]